MVLLLHSLVCHYSMRGVALPLLLPLLVPHFMCVLAVTCQQRGPANCCKDKIVPLHSMRAYGEWRTCPVILKLGTGWRCVVNFTPRLLDPRETTLVLVE